MGPSSAFLNTWKKKIKSSTCFSVFQGPYEVANDQKASTLSRQRIKLSEFKSFRRHLAELPELLSVDAGSRCCELCVFSASWVKWVQRGCKTSGSRPNPCTHWESFHRPHWGLDKAVQPWRKRERAWDGWDLPGSVYLKYVRFALEYRERE